MPVILPAVEPPAFQAEEFLSRDFRIGMRLDPEKSFRRRAIFSLRRPKTFATAITLAPVCAD
jgi:hypothetical protein